MWMNGSVSRCVYVCVWCWTGSCGPLEERKINTPPAAWQLEKVGAQRRDPRLCPHPGSQHQMMLSLNSPPKKVANWTAYWETRQESSSPSSWASRSATTDLIQAFCHLWNCTALRVLSPPRFSIALCTWLITSFKREGARSTSFPADPSGSERSSSVRRADAGPWRRATGRLQVSALINRVTPRDTVIDKPRKTWKQCWIERTVLTLSHSVCLWTRHRQWTDIHAWTGTSFVLSITFLFPSPSLWCARWMREHLGHSTLMALENEVQARQAMFLH